MHFLIKSPARLHMSLLDLNGAIGRVDGGFGVALDNPNTVIEFSNEEQKGLSILGPNELQELIRWVITQIEKKFNVQFFDLSIIIKEIIPAHIGLGSKTQFLLSIAYGLCILKNLHPSIWDLTNLVHRGGTSGIGYTVFEHGGFIVDIGHSFGIDKDKHNFLPSSASSAPPAMPLIQIHWPEIWKFLLIKLDVKLGANNSEEVNVFQKFCPIPLEDVEKISHRLLLQIIPSIKELDLKNFADGLYFIETHGFKAIELQLQDPRITLIIQKIFNQYHLPVGISSFGPIIYVIIEDMKLIQEIKDTVISILETDLNPPNVHFTLTQGRNHGFELINF